MGSSDNGSDHNGGAQYVFGKDFIFTAAVGYYSLIYIFWRAKLQT